MSAYQTFTSGRTTEPDQASLLAALRALDATAGVQHTAGPSYVIKKATAWTAPQITAAQNVIDTATPASAQLTAQAEIDLWPISVKALVLALIDQLNTIRAALPTPLAAITPAQALTSIRNKAGTL
jgi:hypothetical protein